MWRGFPRDQANYTECYDYGSDSDLEDEIGEEDSQEKSVDGAVDKTEQGRDTSLEDQVSNMSCHIDKPGLVDTVPIRALSHRLQRCFLGPRWRVRVLIEY